MLAKLSCLRRSLPPPRGWALLFGFGVLSLALTSCDLAKVTTTSTSVHIILSASAAGLSYSYLPPAGRITYTLTNLPSGSDVYFVVTNPSNSLLALPSLRSASATSLAAASRRAATLSTNQTNLDIAKSNKTLADLARKQTVAPAGSRSLLSLPPRLSNVVGESKTFWDTDNTNVPLTLRYQSVEITIAQGMRTLQIWVANDCWTTGGNKGNLVTQSMVDGLADRFLLAGLGNDIYDWVSTILGAEWGTHEYVRTLIEPSNIIDIVLFDIDNDNLDYQSAGGTVGYFWAKDNFKIVAIPSSNEMICFSIDALMLADPDNSWPDQVVSTLAHEFQHMIEFYQNLNDPVASEVWLNEMLSMAIEDLVADKLSLVANPRGILGTDYTSGLADNQEGRLGLFNYYNDDALTIWQSGSDVLRSYSIAYAFGAWLIRNYNGPAVLKAIYNSSYGDYRAVVEAANSQSGGSNSFADLLRQWGVAVLLSDQADAPLPVRYNFHNGQSDFNFNSTDYSLGSINLYNYAVNFGGGAPYADGPWVYQIGIVPSSGVLFAQSNTYFEGATAVAGNKTWTIEVPNGVLVSVVIK